MKKKFVKVMLLGVLTFVSAASFVGCEDYDDDINNINGQIDQLKKDLADLKASIGDCVKTVSYDPATGQLTVTGGDGSTASCKIQPNLPSYSLAITADGKVTLTGSDGSTSSAQITFPVISDMPDAFDPSKLTVDSNGVVSYNGVATSLTLPGAFDASKLTITGEGVILYNGQPTGVTISSGFDPAKLTVNAAGKVLYDGKETGVSILDATTGSITEIKNGEDVVGYSIVINGQTATFSVVDAVPLKSLVFEPQAYLSGIAAMKAVNLTYNEWTANAYPQPTLKGETWTITSNAFYISPKIVAYYHLNPSTVSKAQIKSLKFIFDDKDFVGTRSAAFNPVVESSEIVKKNGQTMLKVTLNATTEQIQAIDASKVSVLALQATVNVDGKEDKVVTSEYVAIYKSVMKNFVLSYNNIFDDAPHHKHLYGATNAGNLIGKAQEAIDHAPTFEVYLNGDPFDLKKVVETHYDEYTDTQTPKLIHKDVTLESTGKTVGDFGLEYVFTASNFITGDNKTPQNEFFDLTDGVVTPKVYSTEGSAATGRTPLVRVSLKDKATGKVLNAGWIKLVIKKEKVNALNESFAFEPFALSCSKKTFVLPVEFMNVNIYNKLGLSKAEFEALYTLNVDANNMAVLGAGEEGVVTERVDSDPNNETSVLQWTIPAATAYTDADGNFAATVTYKAKEPDSRGDVTIKLTSSVQKPSGFIDDANKIKEYWDAGKTYIRMNVEALGSGATCKLSADLDNAFVGNKITVSGVDGKFIDFAANKLQYAYVFASDNNNKRVSDADGNVYVLTVSVDGMTLFANGAEVAIIDPVTHVVTYQQTDEALALLNRSAHNVDPFTAKFDVIVVNACGMQLPLTNEKFDAKFLRPVNVLENATGHFVDAANNGSTVNLLDLVRLTDWREHNFAVAPDNYYKYYDIQAITIDIDNITSSLNGDNFQTPLVDITDQLVLTASYPASADQTTPYFGTLTYKNNGNAVGAFELEIPVTVTYKWGSVSTKIRVNVEKTQGN